MKHKKIYRVLTLSILLFGLINQMYKGYGQDQRTLKTKVVDILTEMPAQDEGHLDKLMREMLGLGEPGILMLTDMLQPPDGEDDLSVRFAINSYAYFITQSGYENQREIFNTTILKAIDKCESDYIGSFLVSMLQITGENDVIPALEDLLQDDFLYEPAIRTLISIHTPEAEASLLKGLKSSTSYNQIALIKALGEMRSEKAVKLISKMLPAEENELKKVVLYALANIGSTKSEQLLFNEARETGFEFDGTNTTQSYLLFIQRTGESGNLNKVEDMCNYLMENAPSNIRIQALTLVAQFKPETGVSLLLKALDDEDPDYRAAALKLFNNHPSNDVTNKLIKKLKNAPPVVQREIIKYFGDREDSAVIPVILDYLNDEDPAIRLSAIKALAKQEGEDAIEPLMNVMTQGNPQEIKIIKDILLHLNSDELSQDIYIALNDMPVSARAALYEVLALRDPEGFHKMAIEETQNSEEDLRMAAYKALTILANAKDTSLIYKQYDACQNPYEEEVILEVILSLAKRLDDQDQKTFLQMFSDIDLSKKARFNKILPEIGSKPALSLVLADFYREDDIKFDAFDILCQWEDLNVLPCLYAIFMEEDHDYLWGGAVNRYFELIKGSRLPSEQKVLLYRKLMKEDPGYPIMSGILEDLESLRIFQSLLLAGQYLDHEKLQQIAAMTVVKLILPSRGNETGQTGPVVARLLAKADNVLSGENDPELKQRARDYLGKMNQKEGFVPLFNGKDLTGWQGLVKNPIARASMDPQSLREAQAEANEKMHEYWSVKDGAIWFNGKGANLCTIKKYGDFELVLDWKITKNGDSGIYLRGTPQVQIWDTSRTEVGAQVGSGGLYNNQKNPRIPLVVADNPVGEWNTFRIIMIGERVTVWLNGQQVVDHVILENYWDRSIPIFPVEQIELQAHGTNLGFRDIYIREIERIDHNKLTEGEKKSGFVQLFNGKDFTNWTGNTTDYVVEDGMIVIYPDQGGHGNLYTEKEYSNFIFRFEFQLTPGANNGLGIRTPMEGDPAYVGMELQILDNTAPIYRKLEQWQYHGSVYGVIPAKRGFLKPVGEWNTEEVIINGQDIQVILNGTVIVDGNLDKASKNGTMDGNDHPGLKRTKGHIGFLGHGSVVRFRNIRIKEL